MTPSHAEDFSLIVRIRQQDAESYRRSPSWHAAVCRKVHFCVNVPRVVVRGQEMLLRCSLPTAWQ